MSELTLSLETLAALKEFASGRGVDVTDEDDVISKVQAHFEIQDKTDSFDFSFADGNRSIEFTVSGLKREIGQTLSSTGLTLWRATEHLNDYIFKNPNLFKGKSICELGSGLGVISILLSKMNICPIVIVTDGDDDTMELLQGNVDSCYNDDEDGAIVAKKLFWGECIEEFMAEISPLLKKESHSLDPLVSSSSLAPVDKFDCVIGADIIYEEEQIEPLLSTVVQIMSDGGEFILAYAKRNVSINFVLKMASEKFGLKYELVDAGVNMEPIYRFTK